MVQQIQQRRDTAAAFAAANTILLPGQIGVEIDTGKIKCGVLAGTAWNALGYLGTAMALPAYPMRESFAYSVPTPGDNAQTNAAGSLTALGGSTGNARSPAAGSLMTLLQHVGYVGSAAAISTNAGASSATSTSVMKVPDATIIGGFRLRLEATIGDTNAAGQFGIGFWAATATWSASVEPSAGFNTVMLGGDSGDATLSLMHNGGSGGGNATKISLGASFPNNRNLLDLYELTLEFYSNGSTRTLEWEARNRASGASLSGSIPDTSKMPVAGTNVGVFVKRGSANVAATPILEFYGYQIGPLA